MGKYLEKAFSWQYFEPTLFTIIGVLLLLLFIVIFLSKKDKNKQEAENKKIETEALTKENSADAFAVEEENPAPLEAPVEEVKKEAKEETKEEKPVMNMEIPEDDPVFEPVSDDINPDFEVFDNPVTDEKEENSVASDIPPVAEEVPIVAEEVPIVAEEVPVVAEEKKEDDDTPVVIAAPEEEVREETPEDTPAVVLEDNSSEKEEEYVPVEVTEEKIKDFRNSFADLASSINKELDELDKIQRGESSNDLREDVSLPKSVDVTPIDEATKEAVADVFKNKPVLEEAKEDAIAINNDLPIKKEEEKPAIEENEKVVATPDFSSFESETYNVNK